MRIKEIIVVEGRDDESRLKQFFDVEVIITNGFRVSEKTFKLIEEANKRTGVIVLTDPDFAGDRIRERINKRVKGLKNAFISMKDATKKNDIGIENASKETLEEALSNVRTESDNIGEFTNRDVIMYHLSGENGSKELRNDLGKKLGIGYGNSKQFLSRLNRFGITKEEFLKALDEVLESING